MKKKIALLLCLSMLLSVLTGCGRDDKAYVPTGNALVMEDQEVLPTEPPAPQQLTMAYYSEKSMNPLQATDYTNRALFSLMYQGLFFVSSNYEAVPILCNRYQVNSTNKTYTFYLDNATFSDGTPVTVEDVLATYQAAKESKFYSGRFTYVHSITPSDDGGICFALTTPYQDFPLLLDIPILKASEIESELPLGSGPYTLEKGLSGTHLRRNMDWWCKDSHDLSISAESISLIEGNNPSYIRDQFEFYDVGLVCANPCAATYADYRCDYELWDCDTGIMLYLGFNITYSQDGIFEDPDLRNAITYAIDRNDINQKYYNGQAKVTTIPAEPGSPYHSPSLAAKYEYDSMRFIQILSHTSIPRKALRLLVNSDDSNRLSVANYIAALLTDYGLPTEVLACNSKRFQETLVRADYDLYLGQTKLPANMDLSEFFRPYGNLSRNGISDAALLSRCHDALANKGNYSNLHQQIMDEGRICPILFHQYAIYATRGLVRHLDPSRDAVFFYSLGKTLADIQQEIEYG